MADTDRELDDVAARALASIILERTADTLHDGGTHAADALTQLEADTGLALDVCAAVLMATSWLAGTGGLTAVAVFAGAESYEPDADESLTDDDAATDNNNNNPEGEPNNAQT